METSLFARLFSFHRQPVCPLPLKALILLDFLLFSYVNAHKYGVTKSELKDFTRNVMETQGRLMGNNFVFLDEARVLKIYTELY